MNSLTFQLTDTLFHDVPCVQIVKRGREPFRKFHDLVLSVFPDARILETGYRFSPDDPDSVFGLASFLAGNRCTDECAATLLSITKDTDAIDEFLTWVEETGFPFEDDVLAAVLKQKGTLEGTRRFLRNHEYVGCYDFPSELAEEFVRKECDENMAEMILRHLDRDGLGEELLAKHKVFTTGSGEVVVFE